jgi:hypothetical protein
MNHWEKAMINQNKVVMLCRFVCSLFILLFVLLAGQTGVLAAPGGNGVDDLRGQWEFTVIGLNSQPLDLTVFINDLGPDPNNRENFYVAVGCLQTASSGTVAPLSMQAIDQGSGRYALSMLSTLVPASQGQPFVVKFTGTAITYNRGVKNDEASGTVSASFAKGNWSATHHDRRRTDCPAVKIPPFSFRADVSARRQIYPAPPGEEVRIALDGQTNIVSAGMLVAKPDGTTIVVPPYTDIFSPNVDFVTEFRYFIPFPQAEAGYPISGKPYTFTLVDALGNPIPGTTQTDVWTACLVQPPHNLSAVITPNQDIDLTWAPVPPVLGFNPPNEGFYQITIDHRSGPPCCLYGANLIGQVNHLIPWNDFTPGTPGKPDGFDYGVGLNKLANDIYQIRVESFSFPPPGSSGVGLECAVVDFGQVLLFSKGSTSINLIPY